MPVAIADPTPAPAAPVGVTAPSPPPPPIEAPVAVAPAPPPAPPAPPPPPRVELPSTDADYLQNPSPGYPAISKRLGETGTVLLRVTINAAGSPERVVVKKSSGFDRLDKVAVDTVQRWRFVPGKVNGVPQTLSYDLPIRFVLE